MGNSDQIEYWNGEAGKRWAQDDDTMARLLGPSSEALLAHALRHRQAARASQRPQGAAGHDRHAVQDRR